MRWNWMFAIAALAAAPPASASPAAEQRAEQLYQQARTLGQTGDREAACARFESSVALAASTPALLEVAACREEAGDLDGAARACAEASQRARAEGDARRAEAAKAKRRALLARGGLVVFTARVESGAWVAYAIDGQTVDRSRVGTPILLAAGKHQLSSWRPGCDSVVREIDVAAGAGKRIELPVLSCRASRDLEATARSRGDREFVLFALGRGPAESPHPRLRLAGYWTVGAGLVALGAGVGFTLRAGHWLDDAYRQNCYDPDCAIASGRDSYRAYQRDQAISHLVLAAGAVAAATGVTLAYLFRRRPVSSGSQLMVTGDPDYAGMSLVGRF